MVIAFLCPPSNGATVARERPAMKVPYANCDFADIRKREYFYVDKTPFIPHIENTNENHLIFLRPRRIGKSTLISTLESYYDIALADKFDELFGGLWIHENPTPGKNKYLVLTLDFSPVDTTGTAEQICTSFAKQVKAPVWAFIRQYTALIPELASLEETACASSRNEDTAALMTDLLTIVGRAGHQVYLLIDEYDHFGNRMLSDGQGDAYQELVRSTGFVRSFYASLKAFTRKSILARTFITGVSPIMLDDLSSGFNIVTHISHHDAFSAMSGFTQADVNRAIDTLLKDKPELASDPRIGDRPALLATLERYYNGYRFSTHAIEKVYNSTLILYFLGQLLAQGRYPSQMIDWNVRTDYGRLYGLVKAATERKSGTRALLEQILTDEYVTSPLVERFGTQSPWGRAQIVSLFYYMGMLTYGPNAAAMDIPQLVVPNRVMREVQWGYLGFAMEEHEHIKIDMTDIETSLDAMANRGDIQPLLDTFQEQVIGRLSNRDVMNFDEKTMKLMLMAYLCQTQVFNITNELEFSQGYCDLLLGLRGNASANKYAWIIEAKYVKTNAKVADIDKAVEQGYEQIDKYTADKSLVQMLTLGHELKAGVLVFVGLKKVLFRAWPRPEKPAKIKMKKTAAKKTRA